MHIPVRKGIIGHTVTRSSTELTIVSYNSFVGNTVPTELIPEKYRSIFENQESGCTMFVIFFDDTTSSDETMNAIGELRELARGQCFISGM